VLLIGSVVGFGLLRVWSGKIVSPDGLGLGAAIAWVLKLSVSDKLRYLVLPLGLLLALQTALIAPRVQLQPWPILLIWGLSCLMILVGTWLIEHRTSIDTAPAVSWGVWEIPAVTAWLSYPGGRLRVVPDPLDQNLSLYTIYEAP
jgi:hypothetical protein